MRITRTIRDWYENLPIVKMKRQVEQDVAAGQEAREAALRSFTEGAERTRDETARLRAEIDQLLAGNRQLREENARIRDETRQVRAETDRLREGS